jgi:hypothetical protein
VLTPAIELARPRRASVKNRVIESSVLLGLLFCLALCMISAAAQQPTGAAPLSGTWSLVLVDNILPDGSRVHLYGDNPQGLLTFDAAGHYALQIFRAGRPRFAANDKSKGTPEENQAAVQGSNAHFGAYTVDEKNHTVTFSIEHASFPNWEGTKQVRAFTLIGNRFKYIVPTPTTGGSATGEVEWQRIEPQ